MTASRAIPAQPTTPRSVVRFRNAVRLPLVFRSGLGLAVLASVCVTGVVLFVFGGWGYYFSPQDVRAYTDVHSLLRPSGIIGNLLGITGLSLMVIMHGYSLRKRIPFMKHLGSLKTWLEFHIFCGFFGHVLITLHTSFKFNALVSVAYWSMLIVVASGFIGRYLYVMIPRSIRGRELSDGELSERASTLKGQVVDSGLSDEVVARIHAFESQVIPRTEAEASWSGLLFGELEAKVRFLHLRRFARRHSDDRQLVDQTLATIVERAALLRRIAYLKKTKKLFDLWRVYHKPLAILMALIVVLHVGIVAYLGYAWAL